MQPQTTETSLLSLGARNQSPVRASRSQLGNEDERTEFLKRLAELTAAGVDPLITDLELAAVTGCSRTTVWRRVKTGVFPRPIRIGGASRWRYSKINAVFQSAEEEADAA